MAEPDQLWSIASLKRMTLEERGRYAIELAERVRCRLADAGITIGHKRQTEE